MLKACFDESTDEKAERVYSIGGYFGRDSAWEEFDARWADALNSQDINVFHTVDFMAYREDFEGWDRYRHIAFLRELICIINSVEIHGFHAAVKIPDFHSVFPGVKNVNAPHLLCMKTCIENALYMTSPFKEEIAFIFEDNPKAHYRPLILYDQLKQKKIAGWQRMGAKGHVALKQFRPLQAADLIAWEGRRHLDNEIQNLGIPLRKSLELLNCKNRLYGRLWNRESLEEAKANGSISENFFL